MKILYISIEFSKLHIQIIDSIVKNDNDVFSVVYSLRKKKCNILYENSFYVCFPMTILRGPILYNMRLKYISKKIYDEIKKYNFDLIHGHMLFCDGYICRYISSRTNTPYVVSVRNTDINTDYLWKLPLIRKSGFNIISDSSGFIFVNHQYKNQLLSKIKNQKLKMKIINNSVIIANGIDNYWIDNMSYQKKNFDSVNILTVGRVEKNKNQLNTAKAIEKLIVEGYEIKYTIVGDISNKKYFKKLGKYNFIEYHPNVNKEKLLPFYRSANIYVMPSFTETFGITYIEAISQNCPVVYSIKQGIDGFFEQGSVGYGVNPKSIDSIAMAIKNIITEKTKLNNIVSKYCLYFSWDRFSNEINDFYMSKISSKG